MGVFSFPVKNVEIVISLQKLRSVGCVLHKTQLLKSYGDVDMVLKSQR